MAQNLDPNSDGRGVLQFKTGLQSIIKVLSFTFVWHSKIHGTLWFLFCLQLRHQLIGVVVDCVLCTSSAFLLDNLWWFDYLLQQKLAKRDGTQIDRSRDVERLWNFYLSYKRRHRVDDIQREEQKWRETGTFSSNLGEYDQLMPLYEFPSNLVVCCPNYAALWVSL